MKRIAKYETNDAPLRYSGGGRETHRGKQWSKIGDLVLDNLKTFKELIELNNELKDETDE